MKPLGNVLTGPAQRPLDPLLLTVEPDGTVLVDTESIVARESRIRV
jgi:Rieske Fe-S protein